jgi:triphosphoribosyl-dephospho-CoA synthase
VKSKVKIRAASRREIATLVKGACVLEVLAPKAGNVHSDASFADTSWTDFVLSAAAVAPVFGRESSLGGAVLASVRATQKAVGRNTNLGIILLLAPLSIAALRCGKSRNLIVLRRAVKSVFKAATLDDSRRIYAAIALAKPGGLGRTERGDVTQKQVMPILDAMGLAAERDQIARQWTTGFADVFDILVPAMTRAMATGTSFESQLDAIAQVHLQWIAAEPESLIARKCGLQIATIAMKRARAVVDVGGLATPAGRRRFAAFDRWLRADGNRRNPGTAADLIAAALFVHLWRTR